MANDYTPQQIEEILQMFFDVAGTRQYIGARYVPIFGRGRGTSVDWDQSGPYEPLSIVYYQGDTYTSRRYVPAGISIDNQDYWVITGRYNAQVEQYRQEVLGFSQRIEDVASAVGDLRADAFDNLVPFPDPQTYPKYGTDGQVLSTNADGTTRWTNPVVPDQEMTGAAVSAWLDDHPEATTTVEDGAITTAKLADGTVTNAKIADDTIEDAKLVRVGGVRQEVAGDTTDIGGLGRALMGLTPVQGWERGAIDSSTGADTSSALRLRTTGFVRLYAGELLTVEPNGQYFWLYLFNSDHTDVIYASTSWETIEHTYPIEQTCDMRIVLRKADSSATFYPDERSVCAFHGTVSPEAIDRVVGDSMVTAMTSSYGRMSPSLFCNGSVVLGVPNNAPWRVRTIDPLPIVPGMTFSIASGYHALFTYVNADRTAYNEDGGFKTGTYQVKNRPQYTDVWVTIAKVTEVQTNHADVGSFVAALGVTDDRTRRISAIETTLTQGFTDVTAWEQGAINTSGLDGSNSARLRTIGSVPVGVGYQARFTVNGQSYYWYLLDASTLEILETSGAWVSVDGTITFSHAGLLRITLKDSAISAFTPDLRRLTVHVYDDMDLFLEGFVHKATYEYQGERLLLGTHRYDIEDALTLSDIPAWAQGSLVYGGKLFIFNSNNVSVHSMTNGSRLGTFTLPLPDTNHSNTVACARSLHVGNDEYPYMYVGEYYGDGSIFVIDVTDTPSYAATLVQTISIASLTTAVVGAGYSDFAIDFLNQRLYLIRYVLANDYQATAGNYTVVTTFELPDTATASVTLTDSDILDVFTIKDLIVGRQQCVYDDGKILMTSGGHANPSYLLSIDLERQMIATRVPLSDALDNGEPEALILGYEGILIVCAQDETLHRLTFQ